MNSKHEQVKRAVERLTEDANGPVFRELAPSLSLDIRLVLARLAELERALRDIIVMASAAIDREQIDEESQWLGNTVFNPDSTISKPMKYSDSLLSRMKRLDDARALIVLDTKGESE